MKTKTTYIWTYCMKCGHFLHVKDGGGVSGKSHGLCKECFETYLKDINKKAGKK